MILAVLLKLAAAFFWGALAGMFIRVLISILFKMDMTPEGLMRTCIFFGILYVVIDFLKIIVIFNSI